MALAIAKEFNKAIVGGESGILSICNLKTYESTEIRLNGGIECLALTPNSILFNSLLKIGHGDQTSRDYFHIIKFKWIDGLSGLVQKVLELND